jgi:hypothetical protein
VGNATGGKYFCHTRHQTHKIFRKNTGALNVHFTTKELGTINTTAPKDADAGLYYSEAITKLADS